ncbi:glutamate-1-semialdehyde 2,1-aminomutase [Natranaerobius thermophilus JW/NM-WN-LF]|uniref:Glutamate-1-semialdehyde 2,1-aminomutase n=1 Tax=Natranaerobius thermophilus (strain ATCC BAA-1301 / DSM 18059 / JW/NM-WN-LF) TaxID=457570 RepID=GSA_NATTJ|nr:glutamate-1-semialdehyde 2,1-aminomutase [Natranaerobius thermophilus]B2A1H4.1 RecName: Full=Glutamate-1-semialdehyde 2,1-aminomutase; Short=GSA; AltName: Full=Glutamate-1-semialdehyde aminotransferase; Short=GSA-AT [Natranaerobius thermophilus JW/NM-WN-LF]ACB84714.1 glutamate-1-semialdehyde 2,1-aminomutase [Natranaerobius thermophilus JW/NM-WN-LF]
MRYANSQKYFKTACDLMPGGVNSPARAFSSVESDPLFIKDGSGSKVYDVDDNEYIDYVASYGPLILGHCHPQIRDALKEQIDYGTGYGSPTELENEMAELVIEAVPSIEMVRMVNSGTEATMSALRLARGYTGKNKIVKLTGCYHGHSDSLLIKAGSGVTTLGLPDSPGVPASIAENTITVPYNNLEVMEQVFNKYGDDIAGVILEPVAGNMGVVPPNEGYLEGLRELTSKYGSLLIFDEVMTGFRVSYGGAQAYYGVTPDLTCLGKVIGGGLPVGAYGGKEEIMEYIAPAGSIYQAGTLSGNPIAMRAGIETLKVLRQEGSYDQLESKSKHLAEGLAKVADKNGVSVTINRVGTMVGMYFTEGPVTDFESATSSDNDKFVKYFETMLSEGVYLAPSQFEAMFMSLVHTQEDIEKTIQIADKALSKAAQV